MATTIAVPLNTMLADLDETLRRLLKGELGGHGFDGVSIAFDAPTKEWASALSTPTVNLFLYDLREALKRRAVEWTRQRENGRAQDIRPPMRVEISYAVTAWTRTVEDEHRLLSQILAILYAHHTLPDDALVGTLANGSQRLPLDTTVGQPKSDGKADFWSAVGGQYKASLDYVVLASCESGTRLERGPDVREQRFRFGQRDGTRASVEERHTLLGRVVDEHRTPADGAWLVLPETGGWTIADAQGRFRFTGLPPGPHRCVARGSAGGEVEAELIVPGAAAELVLKRNRNIARGA